MVDDGQYAVISPALRESRDQVHGYLSKRGVVIWYRDFVQRCLCLVRQVLVLLTDCAPLYVMFDPGAPSRPTEALEYFPGGLVLPRVGCQPVMIGVHNTPANSFVGRDDELPSLVEP